MSWRDWLAIVAIFVGLLGGMKVLIADPIDKRLDRLEAHVAKRFDEMERRFDGVDEKLSSLDVIEHRLSTLERSE